MELVLCWTWGLPWSVVDIPYDTPLEKADFPFTSEYQLQKGFFAGGGASRMFTLPSHTGTLSA